jgi:hypothetical protein
MDITGVINELTSAQNGAVVFVASTGNQYSLENPDWGNGAFSKAVIEGLNGKADERRTGRITVTMLDLYVAERVKELTRGQQTPTTTKPTASPISRWHSHRRTRPQQCWWGYDLLEKHREHIHNLNLNEIAEQSRVSNDLDHRPS